MRDPLIEVIGCVARGAGFSRPGLSRLSLLMRVMARLSYLHRMLCRLEGVEEVFFGVSGVC